MATNLYFNNFPVNQVTNEQLLVEDLMIEAMKIYGIDVYYLPRTTDNSSIDKLYGEDQLKKYVTAYPIECTSTMYLVWKVKVISFLSLVLTFVMR